MRSPWPSSRVSVGSVPVSTKVLPASGLGAASRCAPALFGHGCRARRSCATTSRLCVSCEERRGLRSRRPARRRAPLICSTLADAAARARRMLASASAVASPTSRMPSAYRKRGSVVCLLRFDRATRFCARLRRPCARAPSSSLAVERVEIGQRCAPAPASTSWSTSFSPSPSMSIARRQAKWQDRLLALRRAEQPAGAAATASPSSRIDVRAAHRAASSACVKSRRASRSGAARARRARLPGSRRRRAARSRCRRRARPCAAPRPCCAASRC